jgi:hypothetical protein
MSRERYEVSDGMETILHLGAHRTASTRIQADLDDNAALLAEAGILVLTPPRPGKREGATVRDVVRGVEAAMRIRNPISRHLQIGRLRSALEGQITRGAKPGVPLNRLIVSDEMLLGPAFARDGRGLYRGAAKRLAAFKRALQREVSEVHLTIRSYDTFLVSVYAMRAVYAGPLPAFRTLAPVLLRFERGWPELVADVARTYPTARMFVTIFEQQSIESRIADLVGDQIVAQFAPTGNAQPNVSPTLEAIEAAVASDSGCPDPDALIFRHAGGTRFDPLDATEKALLRDRYARDLDTLRQASDIDLRPDALSRPTS